MLDLYLGIALALLPGIPWARWRLRQPGGIVIGRERPR